MRQVLRSILLYLSQSACMTPALFLSPVKLGAPRWQKSSCCQKYDAFWHVIWRLQTILAQLQIKTGVSLSFAHNFPSTFLVWLSIFCFDPNCLLFLSFSFSFVALITVVPLSTWLCTNPLYHRTIWNGLIGSTFQFILSRARKMFSFAAKMLFTCTKLYVSTRPNLPRSPAFKAKVTLISRMASTTIWRMTFLLTARKFGLPHKIGQH